LLHQFRPQAPTPERLLEGTVLRVDLRTLGWDQSRGWEEALAANPYGLIDPQVKEVMELTGNSFPFVRADWFVATASQEPLFSGLGGKGPQPSASILKVREVYEGNLTIEEATYELGLKNPGELRQKIQANSRLQNLLAQRKLGRLASGESV